MVKKTDKLRSEKKKKLNKDNASAPASKMAFSFQLKQAEVEQPTDEQQWWNEVKRDFKHKF